MTQKISGINLIHLEDYIKRKWGTDGLDIYKQKNIHKYDKIFEEKLYPFNEYIDSLRLVRELFDDSKAPFQIGWHRAQNMLLTKGLTNYGIEIVEKVISAWSKFNNFGEISIDQPSETHVSISILKYQSDPVYCERNLGFFSGLVDRISDHNFDVKEIKCVCNGSDHCEFEIKE